MSADREKSLEEFIRSLKKSFNITCLFSRDHPLFIKAIEDFKKTVEPALVLLSPIKIGVTPDSFVIEDKKFSGGPLYGEMAKMFHLRRIQGIEIRQGITVAELVILFQVLAMHPKEIMAKGGIKRVFDMAKTTHIRVEELDYSRLLKDSGVECKDVWMYLLKEAVEAEDSAKVDVLADNFDKMVQHFRLNEILENEEMRENIHRFIAYLKSKGKDKFSPCAKGMASSILREKDIPKELDLDKLRVFFEDLTDKDFADILGEGLSTDQGFNPLSFALFSKILTEEKHKNIALLTARSFESRPYADKNKLAKNIGKLFSDAAASPVSRVYQSTLSNILNDISFRETQVFDPELIYRNYHFLLLNLFFEEKNQERLNLILEKLAAELDRVILKKDLEYMMFLSEGIRQKRTQEASFAQLFEDMEKKIYSAVEQDICEEKISSGIEYFLENMQSSSLGLDFYLHMIFDENKFCINSLKLFFKFFPNELVIFQHRLEQKLNDMEFLDKLFVSLALLNDSKALQILKYIYPIANNLVKVAVIKTMRKFAACDNEFLLKILREGEFSLKKEALVALMKDEQGRQEALRVLFDISSPWGTRNYIILENIIAVEEAGFRGARDYLVAISKRRFFWNKNIRKEALRILKKWAQ